MENPSAVLLIVFGVLSIVCSALRISQRNAAATASSSRRQLQFSNKADYIAHLDGLSKLPAGFSVGRTDFKFEPFEVKGKVLPMRLTLIKTEAPSTSFAAMFTSNLCPGGPIILGRRLMKESKALQALVINNKISNVCPGSGVSDRGVGDSQRVCDGVASALGLASSDLVLPSSTGIIGWRLPVDNLVAAVPAAVETLQSDSILPAAIGICTTDRYAKIRRYDNAGTGASSWSVVGIAKGAGMIEPNMATMLSYIVTDLDISREKLQQILQKSVKGSFNQISVDGDQSTSDTVVLLSSQKVAPGPGDEGRFEAAVVKVCRELAEDIVRNGEGTQHVMKVRVTGAPTDAIARRVGLQIVNSPLVKCAIAGCDPNVGRIVGAVGSYLGTLDDKVATSALAESMRIKLGGVVIYANNTFKLDPVAEKTLSDYMLECQLYPSEVPESDRTYPTHEKCVEIEVEFGSSGGRSHGDGAAEVIGSDLTKEYVEINADYRS